MEDALILGELSLDGSVRLSKARCPWPICGATWVSPPVRIAAVDARSGALVPGIDVYPIASLAELVQHLQGVSPIAKQNGVELGDLDDEPVYAIAERSRGKRA